MSSDIESSESPSRDKKSILINLRMSPEEFLEIQTIARHFAGGNLSAWVRQRCLRGDAELESDLSQFLYERKRKSKLGEG